MAGKKANPAPAVRKVTTKARARTLVRRQVTVIAVGSADPRRLLREAAWSQMFGRVEFEEPIHSACLTGSDRSTDRRVAGANTGGLTNVTCGAPKFPLGVALSAVSHGSQN